MNLAIDSFGCGTQKAIEVQKLDQHGPLKIAL